MNVYERIQELCKKKGVSVRQMEIDNGMIRGKAGKWKTYTPKADALLQLSEYFGVSTDYILTGEEPDSGYYADREANQIAEEILHHKELKALFDIVKDMPKDRIESLYYVLKKE
nr:MAG TPA: repressor protein [Caudoviricetes sp.]